MAKTTIGNAGNLGEDTKGSSVTEQYAGYTSAKIADEKKVLDSIYKYRLALEKKFNKQNEADLKKINANLSKYEAALRKKLDKDSSEDLIEAYREAAKIGGATMSQKMAIVAHDFKKGIKEAGANLGKSLQGAADKAASTVDSYISTWTQYSSSINTRLQGTTNTFEQISKTLNKNLTGNQFVKQTKVLENLNSLVEKGIAYNVEQRAFLASITDKIATTFNVTNSTLLRIIRLQQQDSTVARIGMSSSLNKFLNAFAQDTSYLSEGYESTESALLEAISQLGTTAGTEFEYVVQKWLGALSSVGFSSNTTSSLATALGHLGSGNISALQSSESLQNLIMMGANRAGLSYGDLLTGGLDAQRVNRLMQGIVSYAQEISSTTANNQVVRSQYANLFGMTISDMTALLQLSSKDLVNISKNMLTYSQMVGETESQLATVGERTPLAERIQNVYDNIMLTTAAGIANNAGTYATWLVTNLVEQATGGINIPSVFALGTGVDLNTTVTQLMKTGIMGYSLLGQVGNIVSALGASGRLSLSGWGASDITQRGTGFTGIKTGSRLTTSMATQVGNAGGSDIATSVVDQATAEAEKKIKGEEVTTADHIETIMTLLQSVIDGPKQMHVIVDDYGLTHYGGI